MKKNSEREVCNNFESEVDKIIKEIDKLLKEGYLDFEGMR